MPGRGQGKRFSWSFEICRLRFTICNSRAPWSHEIFFGSFTLFASNSRLKYQKDAGEHRQPPEWKASGEACASLRPSQLRRWTNVA